MQSQIWYFCAVPRVLLISALTLLAALFLSLSFLTNWRTFYYFFGFKCLCSDLTLHQFSCLFLDFLISKIHVSKWCDLVTWNLCLLLVSFPKKERVQLEFLSVLVWDVFLITKTPFDFWRMPAGLCCLHWNPLHRSAADFVNQFLSVSSFKRTTWWLAFRSTFAYSFFWTRSLSTIVRSKVNFYNLSRVLVTYAEKWRLRSIALLVR